jgi:hypothetical protein
VSFLARSLERPIGCVVRAILRRWQSGPDSGEARADTYGSPHVLYAWAADWTGSVTKADLAEGRIPLVNWEPHHIDFAKIIDGSLDATIMARANSSKALGKLSAPVA